MMTKNPPRNPRSGRLSEAVEEARAHSERIFRAPAQSRNVTTTMAKPVQRAIKYPNSSAALRQHVVEARRTAKPASAVRLRVGPPADPGRVGTPARAFAGLRAPASDPTPQTPVPTARAPLQPEGPPAIETVSKLGEIVRLARRRRGLSQAELAALAGTGRRFVSEVEAGKPTVEFERLLKVCSALGVSLVAVIQTDDR